MSKAKVVKPRPWAKWLYNEWREVSDGSVTRYAEILSDNAVAVRTSHGTPARLAITLRSGPGDDDVILTLSKGRFECARSYCQVLARFDDGAVLGYTAKRPRSGNPDVLFVNESDTFLDHIRHSKMLIIRAELEQEGRREFAFDTVGLRWP